MPLFSQRKGLKPLAKAIQLDAVDLELKNRLWSLLQLVVWDRWNREYRYDRDAEAIENLLIRIWVNHFKRALDQRPPMFGGEYGRSERCYDILRQHFFTCNWAELYDFIEFILANIRPDLLEPIVEPMNKILTEENSAYRLLNGQFVDIVNAAELSAVDEAGNSGLRGVSIHIETATKLLSDRKNPDYRNSIKESISAVEALLRVVTNSHSVILSASLKQVRDSLGIHPSLIQGFEKIYAYSSDEKGVRHALHENDAGCTHADAKFMLIACSAFVNYVVEKLAEQGKNL